MPKGRTGRELSRSCWPAARVLPGQRLDGACSLRASEGAPDSGSRRPVVLHAFCVLAAVLSAPAGHAQFSPLGVVAEVRDKAESRAESERRLQWEAAYEARRARAHSRLGASASSVEPPVLCSVFAGPKPSARGFDAADTSGKFAIRPFVPRSAPRPARMGWRATAAAGELASDLFRELISWQVVQSKCINCHVEGGVSGHTRLVLSPSAAEGHEALNLAVFENFLATVENADALILNKIWGVAHGGGIQVPAGSADFANMERFLRLLGGGNSTSGLSPEALFDGVTMASPAKTLRRAALIFVGRLPTQAELNAVGDGQISSLRRTIRGLMTGAGFHEFLMGSTGAESDNAEQPVTQVRMSRGFWLGKYQVTQDEWETVIAMNPAKFSGCGRCPVEQVSRADAQEFIGKLGVLSAKHGNGARNPSHRLAERKR